MRRAAISLVTLAICVGSCMNIERVPPGFPYERMLSRSDLGAGWNVEQDSFHPVPDAVASYSITFRRADGEGLSTPFLGDQLTVYPNSQKAQASVDGWVADNIPVAVGSAAQVHFEPSHSADTVVDGCRTLTIDSVPYLTCAHIQQHENLVLYVRGMMDGDTFSISEYEGILHTLDTRLSIDLSTPNG
jgi:hypothetical protein